MRGVVLRFFLGFIRPKATCLECQDTSESDAADEIVGGEVESSSPEVAWDGVFECVCWKRRKLREDAYTMSDFISP